MQLGYITVTVHVEHTCDGPLQPWYTGVKTVGWFYSSAGSLEETVCVMQPVLSS